MILIGKARYCVSFRITIDQALWLLVSSCFNPFGGICAFPHGNHHISTWLMQCTRHPMRCGTAWHFMEVGWDRINCIQLSHHLQYQHNISMQYKVNSISIWLSCKVYLFMFRLSTVENLKIMKSQRGAHFCLKFHRPASNFATRCRNLKKQEEEPGGKSLRKISKCYVVA